MLASFFKTHLFVNYKSSKDKQFESKKLLSCNTWSANLSNCIVIDNKEILHIANLELPHSIKTVKKMKKRWIYENRKNDILLFEQLEQFYNAQLGDMLMYTKYTAKTWWKLSSNQHFCIQSEPLDQVYRIILNTFEIAANSLNQISCADLKTLAMNIECYEEACHLIDAMMEDIDPM